jgi:hypothetical protein
MFPARLLCGYNGVTMSVNHIYEEAVVDYSDEWSDEDLTDWTRAGWSSLKARLEEERASFDRDLAMPGT